MASTARISAWRFTAYYTAGWVVLCVLLPGLPLEGLFFSIAGLLFIISLWTTSYACQRYWVWYRSARRRTRIGISSALVFALWNAGFFSFLYFYGVGVAPNPEPSLFYKMFQATTVFAGVTTLLLFLCLPLTWSIVLTLEPGAPATSSEEGKP